MGFVHNDDRTNFCCVIRTGNLDPIVQRLEALGYQRRGFDLVPGIAHDGQAISLVKHLGGGEQNHVVLYADSDGFAAAAHSEFDELTRPLQHLAAAASSKGADYGRGNDDFLRDLAQSGLPYRQLPR